MSFSFEIFLKALVTTSLILLVFIVDPLGIRNSAEDHYEDHILRLWSPFFSQQVSDDVVVILIDDQYIEATNSYPVSYRNLTRMLKTISRFEPQSIFYDILQHHEHSDHLNRWLRTLDSQTFPVFMASNTRYDTQERLDDPNSLRHKIANVAELAAVSWSAEGRYYPLSVSWNETKMHTVAAAMYKDWCTRTQQCNESTIGSMDDSVIVQWTNKHADNQESYFPLGFECGDNTSQWQQLKDLLIVSLTQGVQSEEDVDATLRKRCPPFLTIAASKISAPGAAGSPELKAAIQGKMVLVGYHVTGGADSVVSPVHGMLPGVYFHAMALDNLITLDGEYWRSPDDAGLFNLSMADIIEIAVQTIVLFLVIWFRFNFLEQQATEQFDERQKLWGAFIPMLIIIAVITISIVLSHFVLNVGAPNWYGLILIIFIDLPIFFFFIFEAFRPKLQSYKERVCLFATTTKNKLRKNQ
ncbi:CHASE2 domain-containing protein [Vibrio sp. ZSDZ34]|uniref:CHASE2 domain-containing protein n=1 Tax=Vibrio gelatinilyticus TaxID=2893468 RepID=A0A9X2AZT2_9VIBR|nr:CHASE2 domain-containing protein [Vibrio gelatinilyticus]MCJ2377878.1 CHASE2 domain-containing protein [Vibrio gelatinilyticus]